MSVWDNISNGFGAVADNAGSALSSLGTVVGNGLNDLGGLVSGNPNGNTPFEQMSPLRRAVIGLGGQNAINIANQPALTQLGADLASGNIDQGQYLKSIAQYSPETYQKMILAQMQAKPAAIKNFEDLQSLVKSGEDAQAQGDMPTAAKYYAQADSLNGIIRPQLVNTNTYSSRLQGQPTQAPAQNPNAVTTGHYAPLMNDNAVTVGNIPPLSGTNAPTPPNEVLNNAAGQTPAEKAAAMLGNRDYTNAPVTPPLRQPGQTEAQYKNDLKAWEEKNAAYQSEQKTSGADTNKYDEDVTKRADTSSKMIQLITEMRDAQQNFKSGALAPAQATILKWSRALGKELSPEDVAALSNQQAFNKWTNTLIGQAAKAEGGASRLQAAYNGIVGANPNASLEPETLNKLFDTMSTTAAQDINEQKAWAAQKANNPSLTAAQFRRQYTAKHSLEQEKAGGNLPGYAGNKSAIPTGLPQGTKSNPDGTLTLPDGRIVRKKQ